jgi:hypothetical protein
MSVVPTKERLGDNDVSSILMLLLACRWHSLSLPYDLPDPLSRLLSAPRTLANWARTFEGAAAASGVGVVLLADLDHVDGPRESRLVGVRWVATADEHAARGIEPALDVVVHVLAAHDSSPPLKSAMRSGENVQTDSDNLRRHSRALGHHGVLSPSSRSSAGPNVIRFETTERRQHGGSTPPGVTCRNRTSL